MNDNDIKRRLAPLKSASAPAGFREGFWARLRLRLGSADRRIGGSAVGERRAGSEGGRIGGSAGSNNFGWRLVPAFAVCLIAIGSYMVGRHADPPTRRSADPSLQLASHHTEQQAAKVFREMLELFPSRVNWISFVDGKVDFSISSVAYGKEQTLMPLVVQMRRPVIGKKRSGEEGGEEFEARFLVRDSQEAASRVAWDKDTTIDLKVSRRTADGRVVVLVRLSSQGRSASVEGDAKLSENQGAVVGAMRWNGQLIQVQLTRGAEKPVAREKSNEPRDSIRL